MTPHLAEPTNCAHISTTTFSDYAFSQSLTSLIYTVGRDPLAFRHPIVARMMSHRLRFLSHIMAPLLFLPKYVQPSPSLAPFEIQFRTPRHLVPQMRTTKGLVLREREWTPLVHDLHPRGNKNRMEIAQPLRTGLDLSTQIGLFHTTCECHNRGRVPLHLPLGNLTGDLSRQPLSRHQIQTIFTSMTRTMR